MQALYQKVAGIEPGVCEALVREIAADLAAIIDDMEAAFPGPLPGYDVRIVDGNRLQGTHHRLKELRRWGDAALPGQTLAVLNPHRELIEEVVVCADGHANQKPLFRHLLNKVQPRQCWIADRDFSTREFLFGVQERRGYFLVRHHGALGFEPAGRQRRLGRTDTGVVNEQKVRLTDGDGGEMIVRRITIQLDQLTRDKDTEIHLLTNLPQKVTGQTLAQAYLSRWKIKNAFHKLTMVLRCELNTLGYPQAALFGFCLAVAMYNAVNTILAALRVAHPAATKEAATSTPKFSFYYLADEIAGVSRGMAIVIATNTGRRRSPEKHPRRWRRSCFGWPGKSTSTGSSPIPPASRDAKHGGRSNMADTFRLIRYYKSERTPLQHDSYSSFKRLAVNGPAIR